MKTDRARLAPSLLVAVMVWELGFLPFNAGRTPFWFDELLTFHVSNLHPFSLLLQALHAGADGMPPGYYAIVQLGRMLPGDPQITLRLPSIIGYLLTLLGAYWFARKRLTASAGLMAVLLVTLSPFRHYALEARSYALLVGFLAISAALWQSIDEKRFATPLFAVFLTLAVSCHHLAVVAISVFGIAEFVWTLLSRRIRWSVWAACLFSTVPFFLSLPIAMHFRSVFGTNFWSRPEWSTIYSTYKIYLWSDHNLALILVVFYISVFTWWAVQMIRRRREGLAEADSSLSEFALIGGFLLFPALLALLTKILGSGYAPRYGWPVIVGLALGGVYLFRGFWFQRSSILLPVALLLAFVVRSGFEVRLIPKPRPAVGNSSWAKLIEASRQEAGIPVVIGSGLAYLECLQSAPPDLRDRLVQVVDVESAMRLAGTDTVDQANRILARFVRLRVEDLASFQAQNRRFILYSGGGFDWFTPYLSERKFPLRLLASEAGRSVSITE